MSDQTDMLRIRSTLEMAKRVDGDIYARDVSCLLAQLTDAEARLTEAQAERDEARSQASLLSTAKQEIIDGLEARLATLEQENTTLRADLRVVDQVMDRRDALANIDNRADKILALIRLASVVDPKAELLKARADLEAEKARADAEHARAEGLASEKEQDEERWNLVELALTTKDLQTDGARLHAVGCVVLSRKPLSEQDIERTRALFGQSDGASASALPTGASAPATPQPEGLTCSRCGWRYPSDYRSLICDDPSATGAGTYICGGALAPATPQQEN